MASRCCSVSAFIARSQDVVLRRRLRMAGAPLELNTPRDLIHIYQPEAQGTVRTISERAVFPGSSRRSLGLESPPFRLGFPDAVSSTLRCSFRLRGVLTGSAAAGLNRSDTVVANAGFGDGGSAGAAAYNEIALAFFVLLPFVYFSATSILRAKVLDLGVGRIPAGIWRAGVERDVPSCSRPATRSAAPVPIFASRYSCSFRPSCSRRPFSCSSLGD